MDHQPPFVILVGALLPLASLGLHIALSLPAKLERASAQLAGGPQPRTIKVSMPLYLLFAGLHSRPPEAD